MNILDAYESTGLVAKKKSTTKGGEWAGPCPICGGGDRFLIWPNQKGGEGSYWCRRCGKGGDLVQFLVDGCNYSYPEAFKAVGRENQPGYRREYGQPLYRDTKKKSDEFKPREYESPCNRWAKKAAAFVEESHKALLTNSDELEYLESRGIDEMAVKNFKLGWFPGENGNPCMFRPRTPWGLPEIKSEKTGKSKMLWVPRGLVIPCFKNGKIYRIRIRRPDADIKSPQDIRYYVLPGSGMEAMGLNPGRKAFVVVESELDGFLIARKAGSVVGVVALGNAQSKPGAGVVPYLNNALTILVGLDYDAAGKASWPWWRDNFRNSKLWPVPVGKDPGDAFKAGVDIKEWLLAGLPPVFHLKMKLNHRGPGCLKPPEGLYPFQELKFFLERLPIEIIADQDRHKILFSPGFQNKQVKERVRQLFFENEDIFYYLKFMHPKSIINGGNIFLKSN